MLAVCRIVTHLSTPSPGKTDHKQLHLRLPFLQVLCVNIFALVRHAAQPLNLSLLRELHVDMVGSLDGSCIDPGGLPCLNQLTKLVMTIDTKVCECVLVCLHVC